MVRAEAVWGSTRERLCSSGPLSCPCSPPPRGPWSSFPSPSVTCFATSPINHPLLFHILRINLQPNNPNSEISTRSEIHENPSGCVSDLELVFVTPQGPHQEGSGSCDWTEERLTEGTMFYPPVTQDRIPAESEQGGSCHSQWMKDDRCWAHRLHACP